MKEEAIFLFGKRRFALLFGVIFGIVFGAYLTGNGVVSYLSPRFCPTVSTVSERAPVACLFFGVASTDLSLQLMAGVDRSPASQLQRARAGCLPAVSATPEIRGSSSLKSAVGVQAKTGVYENEMLMDYVAKTR